MPAAQIRPTRLEVNDRFPMLGFTLRASAPGVRAEVAIATDPRLFGASKDQRTTDNFFTSRSTGDLTIARGEAVWVVPPEVLARFVGAERLYFGLATARNGSFAVDVMPGEASPYVSLRGLTGRSLRRVRVMPSRNRPFTGRLEWAGDAAEPGQRPVNGGAAPAPAATAGPAAEAAPYDDGFGPMPDPAPPTAPDVSPPTTAQGLEVDPDAMGIEGPAVSSPAAAPQAWVRAQNMAPEYPSASRFTASPAFTARSSPRRIERIVIHITDASTTASTVNHFTRTDANSSAHYLVGQDGEIVQFVRENDVAWHARGANSTSIGIEHVCVKEGGATYGRTTFPHMPPTDQQYSDRRRWSPIFATSTRFPPTASMSSATPRPTPVPRTPAAQTVARGIGTTSCGS